MIKFFFLLLSLSSLPYPGRISAQITIPPGLFGGGEGGGIPTSTDLSDLTEGLRDSNTTIRELNTTLGQSNVVAGNLNTTLGKSNVVAEQLNTTAGQINDTANRALDTYNDKLSPQIDRALGLGEKANQTAQDLNQTGQDINQTVRTVMNPRNLFIAGLATAAGGAMGALLVNGAVSGIEAIFKYLATDWDAVALDVYESNIRALSEASERLKKLEAVHANMAKTYRIMQLPAFKALREMNQETRVSKLRAMAHESMCNNEITPGQLEQLMSFSGSLRSFSDGTDRLHSELCRYKTLIDTTKLEIQRYVANIQSNFSTAQYALRKKMYEAFDKSAEERESYLSNSDIRLQKAKVALLNCVRGTPPQNQLSVIEEWNQKYCHYTGPEICLTLRQWDKSSLSTGRTHETYNCIWECVPPEMEDINRLGCPVTVPIPLIGVIFGRKSECLKLREKIQDRFNSSCNVEKAQFPVIRTALQTEIEDLPNRVAAQKREADLRIRTLEHTIQQILAGTEGQPFSHIRAIEEYHNFLSEICGVPTP